LIDDLYHWEKPKKRLLPLPVLLRGSSKIAKPQRFFCSHGPIGFRREELVDHKVHDGGSGRSEEKERVYLMYGSKKVIIITKLGWKPIDFTRRGLKKRRETSD